MAFDEGGSGEDEEKVIFRDGNVKMVCDVETKGFISYSFID